MIEVSIHYPVARIVYGPKEPLNGGLTRPEADKVRIEFVLPKRPFLFWSGRLHEAEAIPYPKGYGIAYYDFPTAKALFAPIPFNVLVGFLIINWAGW